jgi:hypothetical protein
MKSKVLEFLTLRKSKVYSSLVREKKILVLLDDFISTYVFFLLSQDISKHYL